MTNPLPGTPDGYPLTIHAGQALVVNGSLRCNDVECKIARGTATLDGSNPTPVTTGLSVVLAAVVGLKQVSAPGDDPSWLSHNYTGADGTLNIYAWKNTGGTDPTLVASTNSTSTVDWIAIGY